MVYFTYWSLVFLGRKNMSKLISFLLVGCILLTGCSAAEDQSKSVSVTQFNNVNKVDVLNGQNGRTLIITDAKKIDEVETYLNTIKMKKVKKEDIKGYSYRLKLREGKQKVTTVTLFSNTLEIDEQYYEADREVETDIFDNLFK